MKLLKTLLVLFITISLLCACNADTASESKASENDNVLSANENNDELIESSEITQTDDSNDNSNSEFDSAESSESLESENSDTESSTPKDENTSTEESSKPQYDENELYTAYISAFSDGLSANCSIEYQRKIEPCEKYSGPQQIEVIVNGQTLKCEYHEGSASEENPTPTYTFDFDNGTVKLSTEGKFVGIRYNNRYGNKNNDKNYTEDECIKIATDFFAEVIGDDIDYDDYEITFDYNDTFDLYDVYLRKNIDGLQTGDYAMASVNPTCGLYYYWGGKLGSFPNEVKTNPFDLDIAKATVYSRLDEIFESEKYVKLEYEEPDYSLACLKDGTIALSCSVDICAYLDENGYIPMRLAFMITEKPL